MSTNSKQEQRKLNTTPLSIIPDSLELLPRRAKIRLSKKKRKSSVKLTKDEIKYQRFVHDLRKDIQVYMKECLRENRFDTRDHQWSKTNTSFQLLRTTLNSIQPPSILGSHRNNSSETIITKQHDPLSFLKHNETKRLAADVQAILTGPEMKNFYVQFIRPLPHQQPISFKNSFLNVTEQ